MTKKNAVFIAILTLIAGASILASEGNPMVYAAPRMQGTETPRPTPTNEPQPTGTPVEPTNTPESPTDTPESPTNTPELPTNTPVPPTSEPKPTSKPKKKKSSGSSSPTSVPPAPTVAVSDSVPSTGFGSVGGWTLGVTGLILVCVLIVARRLRIGKGNRTGKSDTYGEPGKHRHP